MIYNDEIIPKYRKKSKKQNKKSDHKHIYEPVILQYFNKYAKFDHENGFVGATRYSNGCRCKVCGKLDIGFNRCDNSTRYPSSKYIHALYDFNNKLELLYQYPELPIVKVNDIFNLNSD